MNPGDQLPGERDLAEQMGASRQTIREVVSRMSRSGQLIRKWGSGTFIPTMRQPFVLELNSSVVLRLDATVQGFDAHFSDVWCDRVLAFDAGDVSVHGGDSDVWKVHRVLRLDGIPVMRLTDHVPAVMNGVELDFSDFGTPGNEDLIIFVRERTDLLMVSMDAALRTAAADAVAADLLDIEEGSPLLVNEFVGRSADDHVITRARAEYVQGRVELRFRTSWSPDQIPQQPQVSDAGS